MGPVEITWMTRLALVLVRGVLFGFIFQREQALRFHQMIVLGIPHAMNGNLMFITFMAGILGVSILNDLALIGLQATPRNLPANILGILIIGVGLSTTNRECLDLFYGGFTSFFGVSPSARHQKASQKGET